MILFHAGFETFAGGFVGVDVFFVISGYLITSIILTELRQQQFSIVDFYERRARRILPALFLVMGACLPLAWLWLPPTEMRDFSQSLVATVFFSSNVLFWLESGYFDTAAELKPLLHTWSLAVEEQYYLLFPLLLIGLWRFGQRLTLGVLILCFLLSLAAAARGTVVDPAATFYLLPTRAWELLLGSFISVYLSTPGSKSPGGWMNELGSGLGLGLIGYAVFAFDQHTPFPGVHALVPTLGTALIILAATPQTLVGRILAHRLLVGIGLISYSAYLWHQPLFAFHRHSSLAEQHSVSLVLILLTLLLAVLSWKYVESPFRNRKRFDRRQIFRGAAAGILFFAACGLAGHLSHGFDGRAHVQVFRDLDYDESDLGRIQCAASLSQTAPVLSYCQGSAQRPDAILLGDSHAGDKFLGISSALPEYRWGILGNHSCPPLYATRFRSNDIDCSERLQKLFTHIDQQPSIQLAVLAFAHMHPLPDFIAADQVRRGFDPADTRIERIDQPALDKVDAFYAGLQDTVQFLEQRNIQVVILLDIPELRFFPIDCLRNKPHCHFSRAEVLQRQQLMRSRIAAIAREHPRLAVFDPLDLYCSDDSCQIMHHGRPLYRDSHHLSHYGSREYGTAFARWYAARPD
ncbi:MAG: acyltransferase [Xanthomonadales bacterium]|nr:acyltransferase [Xanthomonadales bacterium]